MDVEARATETHLRTNTAELLLSGESHQSERHGMGETDEPEEAKMPGSVPSLAPHTKHGQAKKKGTKKS